MVPIPEGAETHEGESDYTDSSSNQDTLDQPTDLDGSGGFSNDDASKPIQGGCELTGY